MLDHLRLSVATATGIAAVLALTGCGSDAAPAADKKETPVIAPAPAASPSAGGAGGAAKAGTLDGGWISMQNPGKGVVLTVKGRTAFVVEAATGLTCEGTSTGAALDLTCPAGATRSKGKVDSVDATTLKVTWEGAAGTDTFQRSDAKLPSLPALPTKK
ncbi:hypothetical protein ACGFXC_31645 [Streptomyces sp. NPDC048507]|uniref:hypothetical protein n=1 Tax=Streptomyces sp. NPDC048507 TaxID=3365560 RepID=UPI00371CF957